MTAPRPYRLARHWWTRCRWRGLDGQRCALDRHDTGPHGLARGFDVVFV